MHVTLQDVAKQAGVSTKTVSRVVNNQGEISQATRQRVQAAIEQLGYRPNILARSLVSQRSNTLAVVAWGIDYFGPSRTVVGIEKKSDELGYSLFLSLMARPDDPNVERVLDGLVARRVDGIIWAVPEVGDNRVWFDPRRLERLPPMVFLSMEPRPGLSIVAINNRIGAMQTYPTSGRSGTIQHRADHRALGLVGGARAICRLEGCAVARRLESITVADCRRRLVGGQRRARYAHAVAAAARHRCGICEQ